MESNTAEQEANGHDRDGPKEDPSSSYTVNQEESSARHDEIGHRHRKRGQSWTLKTQYGEDGGGEVHQGVLWL